MVVALACIIGLIFLVVYFMKRLLPGAARPASERVAMQILGQLSVGSRQRVCVLRVQDQTLLIGITEGSINTLAELSTTRTAAQKEADDPKIFADLLSWRKDVPASANQPGGSPAADVLRKSVEVQRDDRIDDGPSLFAPGERPSR